MSVVRGRALDERRRRASASVTSRATADTAPAVPRQRVGGGLDAGFVDVGQDDGGAARAPARPTVPCRSPRPPR